MNIDAQDAQDNQDETLLHEKLTQAIIACGFADAQDYKTTDFQKKSCASCASMLIKKAWIDRMDRITRPGRYCTRS